MRKLIFVIAAAAVCTYGTVQAEEKEKLTSYVNPMIGTSGMGHTFPGACAPFGIVQLSPETDTIPQNVDGKYQGKVYEYCAGYQHDDPTIVGFSHTHLSGTGHSDLGDIMIMPQTGKLMLNPGTAQNPDAGYRSRYSHSTEKAAPGYYEVTLQDNGVRAQLTATQRVGVHKYTFPKGQDSRIILDLLHGIYNYDGKVLWSSIRVENDTLLTGYRITNGWAKCNYTYFAISLSKPIKDYGYRDMKRVKYRGFMGKLRLHENFPEISGRDIVAYFNFDNATSQELVVKVALSGVSTDGALKNLRAEAAGKSFEQIYAETDNRWNEELDAVECKGTPDQMTMLYTSLYHTMINPSIYMDVDHQYRGLDGNIHRAEGFDNYTIFSLWDTYRAEHPLLGLLKPSRNTNMVKSMIAHQQQSVHHLLPVWSLMGNEGWCMTGYHGVSVIADALVKGADIDKDGDHQCHGRNSQLALLRDLGDTRNMAMPPMTNTARHLHHPGKRLRRLGRPVSTAAKAAGYEDDGREHSPACPELPQHVLTQRRWFRQPRRYDGSWKPPTLTLPPTARASSRATPGTSRSHVPPRC